MLCYPCAEQGTDQPAVALCRAATRAVPRPPARDGGTLRVEPHARHLSARHVDPHGPPAARADDPTSGANRERPRPWQRLLFVADAKSLRSASCRRGARTHRRSGRGLRTNPHTARAARLASRRRRSKPARRRQAPRHRTRPHELDSRPRQRAGRAWQRHHRDRGRNCGVQADQILLALRSSNTPTGRRQARRARQGALRPAPDDLRDRPSGHLPPRLAPPTQPPSGRMGGPVFRPAHHEPHRGAAPTGSRRASCARLRPTQQGES